MRKIIEIFFIIWVCTLGVSCAGGGGSLHVPPDVIYAGESTKLILKLTTGEFGKSVTIIKRYRNVLCHYRIKGEDGFITLPFVPVKKEGKWQVYECTLPPFKTPGIEVEYYIDMLFDGVYNKFDVVTVSVRYRDTLYKKSTIPGR
jgi:hypothetical protein